MIDLSKKIRQIEKFKNSLDAVQFSVEENKSGFAVKCGEKFNVIVCPDRKMAQELCDSFNLVLTTNIQDIKKNLSDLSKQCNALDLFSEEKK